MKKLNHVALRLDDTEAEVLEQTCKGLGLNQSQLLRMLIDAATLHYREHGTLMLPIRIQKPEVKSESPSYEKKIA